MNNIRMENPFKIGDKVFAKVRGYPAWPARIENIIQRASGKIKFQVFFYGTYETGVCKFEDVFHYNENKEKYGKPLNRRGFSEALDQIEGISPYPPITTLKIEKEEYEYNDATLCVNEDSGTNFEPISTQTKLLKRKRESGIDKVSLCQERETLVPPRKKFKSSLSGTVTNNSIAVLSERDIVRRSGRKIKPKKFADEDTDEKFPKKIGGDCIKKETVLDHDEKNCKISEICEEPLNRLTWLKNEARLLELEISIRSHLGLNSANTEKTIEALQQLYKLNIKPLMLKKYPHIVQTIKKCRRYVGNSKAWSYTEEQKIDFVDKASDVRTEAENVFKKFKDIFSVTNGTTFTKIFEKEVSDFKKLTFSMSHDKMCALTQEPTADTNAL